MRWSGLAVAVVVFVLDQASKAIALARLDAFAPVEITPFLNLVVVWNPGVSFGMFGGAGPHLLTGMALAITAVLLVWLWRVQTRWSAIAIGLVIGGAIGNVVDRLRFGAVFDFVDVHAMGYHWPAFNVADAGITVGAVLIVVDSLFGHEPRSK